MLLPSISVIFLLRGRIKLSIKAKYSPKRNDNRIIKDFFKEILRNTALLEVQAIKNENKKSLRDSIHWEAIDQEFPGTQG
jgi:hypothetical protein